jgi:hypothetical protein
METVHNPDRFMGDLRQVLSQGRKRIGILIGAGAPMSIRVDEQGKLDGKGKPLIPGVDALTTRAIAGLEGNDKTAVEAIRSSLTNGGNIESILSKIRLMQTALGDTVVSGLNGDGYLALGQKVCQGIGSVVGVKLPLTHSLAMYPTRLQMSEPSWTLSPMARL